MNARGNLACVLGASCAFIALSSSGYSTPRLGVLTAQTLPMSPTVLGTLATRGGRIELLVLWRGKPGWFLSGTKRGASYSEAGAQWTANISYGDVALALSFDASSHTVTVQGKAISLPPAANVICVDNVSAVSAPTLLTSLELDPGVEPVDPRAGRLGQLLAHSAPAVLFLQCDVGTDNENTNRMIRRVTCDGIPER